jgi:hypothetical protein
MSKIEKYREQNRIATKITVDLNKSQGLTAIGKKDPNNDKHDIRFSKHQIWDSDIPVWLHASYGYYGSSDGYTACSPELQPYLTKALNHYKMDIVNFIVEQLEHDKNRALYECKEEAESILREIDSIMLTKQND